ncbi:MAG: bifunctional heptose 7-phosphate kinase/heptose 1-phosphate adenyltransferase [Rhodospirillaceae bacterium]|nr:MAG: bifunctional heptose 7-phosphate kinase/heptose 1-phosphate adenyltransferase [Rhodospirillaceae bacterium]
MSDISDLAGLIEGLNGAQVLCIGDVMLDRYVSGSVERISPEAPIPVLRIESERTMLGGVGNVAANIQALNGGGRFIATVGDDSAGREVEHLLKDLSNVQPNLVTMINRPTTLKTRFVGGAQQLMRADTENTDPLDDDIRQNIQANATADIAAHGALVLSDYGKGVLSTATLKVIIEAAKKARVPVIVDPKGNDYTRYAGASIVTPNKKELSEATNLPAGTDDEVIKACRQLITSCSIGGVLATRSADGMTLVLKDQDPIHLTAEAREVFDVSGAGDTVVATLALAIASGANWTQAATLANTAAGIVVGKSGTATVSSDELSHALHAQDLDAAGAKVATLDQATTLVTQWRNRGYSVGFTNGCFDLLHPGHISLLSQSKQACDRLVIGLNSDASVKRLKGDSRPVQTEASRAAVLGALGAVDLVVIFGEDTPINLIEKLRPDVLVKGADYTIDTVVGADIVQSYGGKIVLAKLEDGHSTTNTIKRLSTS